MQMRIYTVGEPDTVDAEYVNVTYMPDADPYVHILVASTDDGVRNTASTALDVLDARALLHMLQIAVAAADADKCAGET